MAHIPGGQTAARAQRPLEHALFSSVQTFFFFLFMTNSIFFFTCNNWHRRRASTTSPLLHHRYRAPWRPIIAKIPQFVRVLPTWWHCTAEMKWVRILYILNECRKNILNHVKYKQYAYKANYLYIYYIIFLTEHICTRTYVWYKGWRRGVLSFEDISRVVS